MSSNRRQSPLSLWLSWAGVLMLAAAFPRPLQGQSDSIQVPPNVIVPNYDRVPIGQREGIEGGAFLARTADAAANWYNPAGLAKSVRSSVNASATGYEWTSLSLEGLGEAAGRSRLNTISTLLGVVVGKNPVNSDHWRFGASLTRPILWRPSSIDFAARLNGGQELFVYSTDVAFEVMIPAVAVAFAPGGVTEGKFRLGAGVGVAMISLSQLQAISDRVTTATAADVGSRTYSAEGSVWSLQPSAGFQWEASSAIAVGARLVLPSMRLRGTSRLATQGSQVSIGSFRDYVFQDSSAFFDYRLPFEADVGMAIKFGAGAAEVDLHYFAGIDDYDMYTSPNPGRLTLQAAGGVPAVTAPGFATARNSAREILNVAVGATYPLSSAFRVHAGFSTDQSPVAEQETSIFRRVNLQRITTGVSMGAGALTGSLGLGYSFGSGTRGSLGSTKSGQSTETQLDVKTFNLLFALSYAFQQP